MEKLERQKHEKLQSILSKPPNQRTSDELVDLAKLLMKNNFLKQFSTNPDFIEMCRYLTLEVCSEKQLVFSQGDEGDNFYIILSGKVGVYISKALNKYKNFNYLKEIARLEAGQSFGELALLYNSVRAASIIALENSELIVLNRETFKKYIHNMQTSQLNHIVDFYEHMVLFSKMDKHELIKLSSKSLMKKYPSKTYLIRQNEEASCIFFIKRGLVQITRRIKFKKNLNNPQFPTSFQDPSEEDIQLGHYVELDLKIGEMGKGQYFGDYEVIHRKKMQFSVFTLLPTELIMLSEYDFKLQVNEEVVQTWLRYMKVYPSDAEIRKKYIETQFWNDYQKRVVENQFTITAFQKNLTLYKKACELRIMEQEVETGEHRSLENLMKDLERQTNFDEFLPYNESQKRGSQEDDNVLPSPFSPGLSANLQTFKSSERKLIMPLRSYPSQSDPRSKTGLIFSFSSIPKKKTINAPHTSPKPTKLDEIMNLQQEDTFFSRKNQRKILPKINKNVGHTINGLLNLL